MTPQVTPAAKAPAKEAGAGAHPVKDGAPPGLFTALLGAATTAAGPPGHAPTPARTAHAEGTPAEGDSSGHTDSQTTLTPMPAPATAVAAPAPALPAAPAPKRAAGGPAVRHAAAPGGRVAAMHAAEPAEQAGSPAAAPAPAAEAPAQGLPLPVVARRPGEGSGPRRITRPSGVPGPVEVPARSPAPAHDHGHGKPGGIPLPAPAPERPRAAHAAPHRPAATPVRHAASAAGAATAAATEAAPSQPAEHVSPAAADAPALPRVRVHELAESMHALIKVANRRGTAAARITLRPAALGGVQVRLRAHAGGVSASLTAQTPAGAQALGAAHGELRRALESQGIAVHTIDVQLAGDRPGPEGGSQGWQPGRSDGSDAQAREDDEEFEPHHTIEPTRLPLADGQVDVLA